MIADHLSRPKQPIPTEWSLHPEIVRHICRVWGTLEVDMYATVSNSLLPRLMSPILDPRAIAVGALSQVWQGWSMYMFPPFSLLNRVFSRSHSEDRDVSHSPWWPNQPCLPHLLHLCVEHHFYSSLPSRSSVSTEPEVHLRRIVVPSARMEALMRPY